MKINSTNSISTCTTSHVIVWHNGSLLLAGEPFNECIYILFPEVIINKAYRQLNSNNKLGAVHKRWPVDLLKYLFRIRLNLTNCNINLLQNKNIRYFTRVNL